MASRHGDFDCNGIESGCHYKRIRQANQRTSRLYREQIADFEAQMQALVLMEVDGALDLAESMTQWDTVSIMPSERLLVIR